MEANWVQTEMIMSRPPDIKEVMLKDQNNP